MHHRHAELHRGVVEQVAAGEVVGSVDHHVVPVEDVHDVVGAEANVIGDDVYVRVDRGEGLLGRVDLAFTDPVQVVEDLALEIRLVDHVHVDDADPSHPGGRQVQGGRRTQTAGSQQQDAGVQQLQLALLAHLGQEHVALVAVALVGTQGARGAPVAALILPTVEAAVHGDHVGVAQLLEGVGGERRADPAGTHDDEWLVPVVDPTLDAGLEVAPRDVDRVGNRPLLELVGLADVEEEVAGSQQRLGARRLDLGDPGLGVPQQVSKGSHSEILPIWSGFDHRAVRRSRHGPARVMNRGWSAAVR